MTAESLQVATWNIHMAVGLDGRRDLFRTAQVIRQLGPDLIALQEVDNQHRAAQPDDLEQLQLLTGLRLVAGPTMQRPTGDYGNALLTRLPVLEVERFDLSVARREPRGLLIVHLDWQGERLQVAVTHLGLRPAERRAQVKRMIGYLETPVRRPLLLMGDLNEWFTWGRPLRWLRSHFGPFRSPATFPSRRPLLRLDHILADPPQRLGPVQAARTPEARQASDHLPLVSNLWRR